MANWTFDGGRSLAMVPADRVNGDRIEEMLAMVERNVGH